MNKRKLNGKRAFFYLQLKRLRLNEAQIMSELKLIEKRIKSMRLFDE